MDLSIISEILKDLVPFHSQISLPGLGCFVVDEKPSQITNGGTVITPPHKNLRFSFSIGTNDGLLEHEYSKIMNENAHDAKMSIEKLVREIKEQLTQNRKVKIPQLGELRFNENGELLFIPANDISIFPASSQPPVVNIVPKESIEYSAPELPVAPAFDNNLMQHILDSALTASIFAKNCRDAANTHTVAELEEKDNILPDNTTVSLTESAPTAAETAQINDKVDKNEGAETKESKEDAKNGDKEKIKDEDVSGDEIKNAAKKVTDEAKDKVKSEVKDKAESETKEVAAGENTKEENQQKTADNVKLEAADKENGTEKETKGHEAAKPKISKKQIWVAVVLIVLIIIILLITIVFVMQDELRPLLEKLLYNARERALIHHFNM